MSIETLADEITEQAMAVLLDATLLCNNSSRASFTNVSIEQIILKLSNGLCKIFNTLLSRLDGCKEEAMIASVASAFVSKARALKAAVVLTVQLFVASNAKNSIVDNEAVRLHHIQLSRRAEELLLAAADFKEKERRRVHNVRSGVIAHAKKLTVSLTKVKECAIQNSSAGLDEAAADSTRQVAEFVTLADAALLGDEGVSLRSSIADVIETSKSVITKKKQPDELTQSLALAVNSIRQVVYGILSLERMETPPPPSTPPNDVRRSSFSVQLESAYKLNELTSTEVTSAVREKDVVGNMGATALQAVSGLEFVQEKTSSTPTDWAVLLERTHFALPYYARHFFNVDNEPKAHLNVVVGNATDASRLHIASILSSPEPSHPGQPTHVAVIRTMKRDELLFVPRPGAQREKDLLAALRSTLRLEASVAMRCIRSAAFIKELRAFEANNLLKTFKIGVVILRAGYAATEESLFGIEAERHEQLERFLALVSTRIRLRSHHQFTGGLRHDSTGTESYFTTLHDLQIMFHVVHLLPYTKNDEQQVERKRHIGNDIVVIVFRERGAPPFDARVIRSQFNMIFIVVSEVISKTSILHYRISVVRSTAVPSFRPRLREPNIYSTADEARFREFFLTLCVNGERAAYSSPVFKNKLVRTRKELLSMLANEKEWK